ncbi:RNA polymerase sigma-70 factor, ECF subfamily [Roseivivax marinus]|jgi:RNA polymerase sigma-70 factor (ECF subfamily)|uniref:sigma-70 family RNA polymerase sigma factor n=2 Tax=Roseivivax marinus TaxID=1379903 RepID=UPI0008D5E1EC|nr:sigma-70 family RNA polymerase sigma factor [Roseivivax marinus]SEL90365.1 RNA polymerase sigma-70 factor, ECF subfamily [Roseivivax marinus]
MPDMLRTARYVDDISDPLEPSLEAAPVSPSQSPDPGAEAALWASRVFDIRDNRSEAAFVAVFEHFAPRLKAFLMRGGNDAATAEEVVQDVMSTVWRKAHMFDPSRASVSTWLFTIARNRRIDIARRRNARPEPEALPWGPDHAPAPEEVIGLQEDSARLGEAMRTLPEKQRRLIESAYFGELTHREIAAETGLPLGTIKSRIRLALDRLRHAMS